MQDRPDVEALMAAVAGFLQELAGDAARCPDQGARYRLRIAAHLCATVGREVHREGLDDAWELEALEGLLGATAPLAGAERRDRVARRQAIRGLERLLCERIGAAGVEADAALDAAALDAFLVASLRRRLEVSQPRFDFRDELP